MILFRVLGGEQRFCCVRSAKYVFVSCLSNARLNGLQFGAECPRLILDFGLRCRAPWGFWSPARGFTGRARLSIWRRRCSAFPAPSCRSSVCMWPLDFDLILIFPICWECLQMEIGLLLSRRIKRLEFSAFLSCFCVGFSDMPTWYSLKYVKGCESVLSVWFWSIMVLLAPRCASTVISGF
jgi:hypothetical protein